MKIGVILTVLIIGIPIGFLGGNQLAKVVSTKEQSGLTELTLAKSTVQKEEQEQSQNRIHSSAPASSNVLSRYVTIKPKKVSRRQKVSIGSPSPSLLSTGSVGLLSLNPGRSILIRKSEHRFYLLENSKVIRVYPCTVGRGDITGNSDFVTPVGRFVVQTKELNHVWRPSSRLRQYLGLDPKKAEYRRGEPGYPLGTRWMRVNGPIGIHGTEELETLGRSASSGCIRLSNKDVEELFDLVDTGTPVEVQP